MSIHVEEREGSFATFDPNNDKLGKLIFVSNGTIFYTDKKVITQPEGRELYDRALKELAQRGANWHPATSLNLALEQNLQELYDTGPQIHLGVNPLDTSQIWAIFRYFGHISHDYLGYEKNVVIGGIESYQRRQTKKQLLELEFQGAVTAQYAYTEPGNQILEKIIPGIGKNHGNSLTLVKENIFGRSNWRNVKARFVSPELLVQLSA